MTLGYSIYESERSLPMHLVPYCDLFEHRVSADGQCWCKPDDTEGFFAHNAYDQRDLIKRGERLIQ